MQQIYGKNNYCLIAELFDGWLMAFRNFYYYSGMPKFGFSAIKQ
jgi:hypothetical protein